MPFTTLPASLALTVAANLLADYFVALDLKYSFTRLTRRQKNTHIVRWCVCAGGLVAFSLWGLPLHMLLVVALFSVSAAIDFETKLLPPDLYVFGCVLLNLAIAGAAGGPLALRDAVVAQAFCFAVVTLGVAFFNVCESGDIKLAMQFGAACGALPMVAVSAMGVWLTALLLVLLVFVLNLVGLPRRDALRRTLSLRPPQGPLLWCGLLVAHAVLRWWYGGVGA